MVFVREAVGLDISVAFVKTSATATAILQVVTGRLVCVSALANLVSTIQPVLVFAARIAETGHASVLMALVPIAKSVTMDRFAILLAVNVTVRAVTKPRENVSATVKLVFMETNAIKFAPAIASLHHVKSQTDIVQHVKMDISV